MARLPKTPNNADKLTEDASVEVMCVSDQFDIVEFFNKNGYNVVSSEDERAADPSVFVYDKRKCTLHTPLLKPEQVLPLMQDLQQKFEQNNIAYFTFRTKYPDQFVEPLSEQKRESISDSVVLEQLQQQKLEKISPSSLESLYQENITDDGPLKLYRGTTMGDSAHTTCSSKDTREMIVYAAPNISKTLQYAQSEESRFGFIEEYKADPKQKYSHDHGLESNECFDDISWKKSEYQKYRNFETSVEKETNPHLCTYIRDNKTGEMYKIYENGKYVNEFWEQYAKSRKPQRRYNEHMSKRVQKIIDLKPQTKSNQTENQAPSRPSFKEKAKELFDKAKRYIGGQKLFSELKEKADTFAKGNPKLLTTGGAVDLFNGIGTANPQLAAAGTIIMAAGAKALADKIKNLRGLGKSNNNVKTTPPPVILDYTVHKNLSTNRVR